MPQTFGVLTAEANEESVLPALALLGFDLRIFPLTTSGLLASVDCDALIVDGRRDLVSARTLCRAAVETIGAPPILLVLEEGGYAVVGASWGAADTVLFCAPAAEIQARLRMLLEQAQAEEQAFQGDSAQIACGDFLLDTRSYILRVSGKSCDLTFKEFELMRALMENAGRVLTREALLDEVWGMDYYGGSRTVDVHIRRLRAKLGPKYESAISTIRNVGYRFDGEQ